MGHVNLTLIRKEHFVRLLKKYSTVYKKVNLMLVFLQNYMHINIGKFFNQIVLELNLISECKLWKMK